jgi:hypothetical protein
MVGWYKIRASTLSLSLKILIICFFDICAHNNLSAVACNLINNDMKQFIISSETDAIREVEERVSSYILLTCFYLYVSWKELY